jgi:hypothetical protein
MEKILNHLGADWYKYLLELIVITAGVLGAFALNNWNEERVALDEEAKILANLNTEFKENGKILQSSVNRLDRVINGLDSILFLIGQEDRQLTTDQFELLLETTFGTPSWSPSSFVLEDIKNSGGLSRLNNDSLKYILLDWERNYALLTDTEEEYSLYTNQYIEYIAQHGSVRNLDAINGIIPSLQRSTITTNDPDKFLGDPIFENRVENFYFLAVRLRKNYRSTSEKLWKIIESTD